MGDTIVLRKLAERLVFGSLLNLRPDIWRKPIPSHSARYSAFREDGTHGEIGGNFRRCLG